jgi:two-component system invasion response regulator UvrY
MKKFLLVDDHVVIRSGIKILLSEICRPCEVYESFDEQSTVEKLKENSFDLVMMDIQMPRTDPFVLMEYIRINYPATNVLIFSMCAENIYAKRFLNAGAKGFLSKDAPLVEIKKAIKLILDNKKYISETMVESLVTEFYSDNPVNPFSKLSSREFEIQSLLLSGQTMSEISRSLKIGMSTAGTYKSRLFEKLGTKNILELKELATHFKL